MFDFEFLNIQPEPIVSLVKEGIQYRNNWFDGTVSTKNIKVWFNTFFEAYETFLESLLNDFEFYSSDLKFKIGPNINMSKIKLSWLH